MDTDHNNITLPGVLERESSLLLSICCQQWKCPSILQTRGCNIIYLYEGQNSNDHEVLLSGVPCLFYSLINIQYRLAMCNIALFKREPSSYLLHICLLHWRSSSIWRNVYGEDLMTMSGSIYRRISNKENWDNALEIVLLTWWGWDSDLCSLLMAMSVRLIHYCESKVEYRPISSMVMVQAFCIAHANNLSGTNAFSKSSVSLMCCPPISIFTHSLQAHTLQLAPDNSQSSNGVFT